MSITILFRADGSKDIGTGHVMRCICLAEELSKRGYNPIFCIKPVSESIVNEILRKGFKVFEIPSHADADVFSFCQAIEQYSCKAVILDGYHFDSSYLNQIRGHVDFILSIDDIAETFYCSDIVLNQNINASEKMYYGNTSENTMLLLGPTYALLRDEFQKLSTVKRDFEKVRNILVSFGGADRDNQTMKVLEALEKVQENFTVTAVLGGSNNNISSVIKYTASSSRKIEVLLNANNMSELMTNADIAISSGGSTSWELCCLGLPALQIILATNQVGIVESLEKRNIAINLGWYNMVTRQDISDAVTKLIRNVDKRYNMSRNGKAVVDGKGAQRVASEICKAMDVKIRQVSH